MWSTTSWPAGRSPSPTATPRTVPACSPVPGRTRWTWGPGGTTGASCSSSKAGGTVRSPGPRWPTCRIRSRTARWRSSGPPGRPGGRPTRTPTWSPAGKSPVPLLVLPLLVPGHLDGLQQLLVRLGRLPLEPLQVEHPLVHVGEPHRERVEGVVPLEQGLADLAGVGPGHLTASDGRTRRGPGGLLASQGVSFNCTARFRNG